MKIGYADYIKIEDIEMYINKDIDIMLEAKCTDLVLMKLRKEYIKEESFERKSE